MKTKLRAAILIPALLGLLVGLPKVSFAEELAKVSTEGFVDSFDRYNEELWYASNGWANGGTFLNGWRDDHVRFKDGILQLVLDAIPCVQDKAQCSDMPYASGEYATSQRYGYGKFETRMKAVKGDGVVTGFFTYGTNDSGANDEIDVEILGKDTTRLETNYFTNGKGNHSTIIPLGFDAAEAFHDYAFEWTPESINWYVDGKLVHTETGSRGTLPSHPGLIMANLWPATQTNGWAKDYVDPDFDQIAQFDSIGYTPAASSAGTGNSVELKIEKESELKVYRLGETEMAPVRFVMESLKAFLTWNGATRQITVNDPASGSTLEFTIGSKRAILNGKTVEMVQPVIVKNKQAYVPLRVLTDAIGATVTRDEAGSKVRITTRIH